MPINNHLSKLFLLIQGTGFRLSTGQLNLISVEHFLAIVSEVTQWGVLKLDDFLCQSFTCSRVFRKLMQAGENEKLSNSTLEGDTEGRGMSHNQADGFFTESTGILAELS